MPFLHTFENYIKTPNIRSKLLFRRTDNWRDRRILGTNIINAAVLFLMSQIIFTVSY